MKKKFFFTEHAIDEMLNDNIEPEDVMEIAISGKQIENYPNDKPHPSFLRLGFVGVSKTEPIHVVCAEDKKGYLHIITTYRPNNSIWDNKFEKRKKG